MTGPAPAVAETRLAVRRTLAEVAVPGDRILVACSGGADSLALAAAVAFEAPRRGLLPGSVTVDHGLQESSGHIALVASEQARSLGLEPALVHRVEVGTGAGPEDAARRARYAALRATAAELGAAWVLLGHTLDDQAETVLLGLARGSGPRSVAGMRPVDRPWLRPLLGVTRAATLAACRAQGLEPWEDPHNVDPRYTRVRLRREVLPLLEDVLGGGVAAALARTAGLLRADLDALDAQAERIAARMGATPSGTPADRAAEQFGVEEPGAGAGTVGANPEDAQVSDAAAGPVEVAALAELTPALRGRVVRSWLRASGISALTSAHLDAVDALVSRWHGQGPVSLPGGWTVRRRGSLLHLCAP